MIPQDYTHLANTSIERAILSSALYTSKLPYGTEPTLFYLPFHRRLFEILEKLQRENLPFIQSEIESQLDNNFDEEAFLEILSTNPLPNESTKHYVSILCSYAAKRLILEKLEKPIDFKETPAEIIADIELRIQSLRAIKTNSYLSTVDIREIEAGPLEVLCKNWLPLPRGTVSLLVAKGGVGKTTIALQIAYRVMLEDNASVFAWFAEDSQKAIAKKRDFAKNAILESIEESTQRGITRRALEEGVFHIQTCENAAFPICPVEKNFGKYSVNPKIQIFFKELEKYDFIILDSLSIFLSGLEENSNSDGRAFYQPFLQWAAKTGKTLLFLHHEAKRVLNSTATNARGAMALIDGARCVYDVDFVKKEIKGSGAKKAEYERNGALKNFRYFKLTKDNSGVEEYFENVSNILRVFPEKNHSTSPKITITIER